MIKAKQNWDQQDGETDAAYQSFFIWMTSTTRPIPSRKIEELIKAKTKRHPSLSKPPAFKTISRWFTDWDWKSRANQYDRFLNEKEVEGRGKAREEAGRDEELQLYRARLLRSAQMINQLGMLWATKVTKWINAMPDGKPLPSALASNARGASALVQTSLDVEGAVLGVDDILKALTRGTSMLEDEQ